MLDVPARTSGPTHTHTQPHTHHTAPPWRWHGWGSSMPRRVTRTSTITPSRPRADPHRRCCCLRPLRPQPPPQPPRALTKRHPALLLCRRRHGLQHRPPLTWLRSCVPCLPVVAAAVAVVMTTVAAPAATVATSTAGAVAATAAGFHALAAGCSRARAMLRVCGHHGTLARPRPTIAPPQPMAWAARQHASGRGSMASSTLRVRHCCAHRC